MHDDDIVAADLDWPATPKGSPRSSRCSTVRACSSRSSPLGSGKIPGPLTAVSPPTARATASTPSTAPARTVDIAREVGCRNYVLWLAREGTYIREAKDAKTAVGRIVDAWNAILEHDPDIRVMGEAKPNEPMDQAYLPTVGHMVGIAYKTVDPSRSGVLIESALTPFSQASTPPTTWRTHSITTNSGAST